MFHEKLSSSYHSATGWLRPLPASFPGSDGIVPYSEGLAAASSLPDIRHSAKLKYLQLRFRLSV